MSHSPQSPNPLRELLTEASEGPALASFDEVFEHVRRRRRVHRAVSAVAVAIGVAVVVPASVAVGHQVADHRSASSTASSRVTVTYPFRLPGGYVEPTGSAADPGSAGVWLFAQGGTSAAPKETVFHWVRATGHTTTYQISPIVPVGDLTPLAVGPSGVAWLGLNSTLLEINPASASPVTRRSLPVVGTGYASEGLPSAPSGAIPAIESLAVNTAGQVVIGRSFATAIQLVDPSTGHVTAVPFPRLHVLDGLGAGDVTAAAGDTAVAAIIGRHSTRALVELVHGTWHDIDTIDTSCPSYGVSATGRTLVLHGEHCLAVRAGPPGSHLVSVPIATSRPVTCAQALAPDLILVCSPGGAYTNDLRSGVTSPLDLGSVTIHDLGGPRMPLPAPSRPMRAVPTTTTVAIVPTMVTSGGAGAGFFVPSEGATKVGLLTTGS